MYIFVGLVVALWSVISSVAISTAASFKVTVSTALPKYPSPPIDPNVLYLSNPDTIHTSLLIHTHDNSNSSHKFLYTHN